MRFVSLDRTRTLSAITQSVLIPCRCCLLSLTIPMVVERPAGFVVAHGSGMELPPISEHFDGTLSVFLVSTSAYRTRGLTEALVATGLADLSPHVIGGPEVEEGDSSVDRAVHKVVSAAMTAEGDGYFRRHPHELTVFIAADSRNYVDGAPRDKPADETSFAMHAEDWERALIGEKDILERTGYAALAVNGTAKLVTIEDVLSQHPFRRSFFRQTFALSRFSDQRKFAHSVGSPAAISGGHMAVRDVAGEILLNEEVAIRRVMGASERHFASLLSAVLPRSVKPR